MEECRISFGCASSMWSQHLTCSYNSFPHIFGMEVLFDALFLNTELAYPTGVTPVTFFFLLSWEEMLCSEGGERGRKRTEVALRLNISSILNCKRSKLHIWPLKNNEVEAWVVFSVLCKYLSPGVESPVSIPDGPFQSGTPQNWAGLATSGTNTRGKFSVLENL